MVNGSPSKPFKMERGLRQVDPLSPFLFVLVVNVLNRMIREAVRNGWISPLLVGRDNIELSHLQFADDTILFCPPEEETLRNYQRLLRCFEMMSGLSINFEKSNLIPVNCSSEWANRMCQLLGCQEAALPVRYLGISLGANPRLVKTWKHVLDKVEEKLNLWNAKVLSKAGKLVLIKSVINSLPIYYLSLYKMPNAVARRIISLQRRFFWGKDDGRPGMAVVKWELIQAPKKLGGLRVGDAVIRNTALLFKWWWRFSKENCPLWKKIEETLEDELLTYKFTKEIWKGLVLPRVELFAWFVLVGRVNTKDWLSRLEILQQNDILCVLCKKDIENIQHLFITCEYSWHVWCAWISAFGQTWVVPGTLKEFFESWRWMPMGKERRKYWLLGFFSVIWIIWLRRNDTIFRSKIT
ncbi:uncharacterized protein LOC130939490 [Arachis stenosperma]|uniref:uncharacterized protein LOC130939490 n=1 Tax=Arachis stenosperma TaxID=217475 RepID=UPI0025ABE29B|nr:uncharacterized protein LOC130939490 [Arachis stenosperma]